MPKELKELSKSLTALCCIIRGNCGVMLFGNILDHV